MSREEWSRKVLADSYAVARRWRKRRNLVCAAISEVPRKICFQGTIKARMHSVHGQGSFNYIGIFFGILLPLPPPPPHSLQFFWFASFRETCYEQIYVRSMYTRILLLTFIYRRADLSVISTLLEYNTGNSWSSFSLVKRLNYLCCRYIYVCIWGNSRAVDNTGFTSCIRFSQGRYIEIKSVSSELYHFCLHIFRSSIFFHAQIFF